MKKIIRQAVTIHHVREAGSDAEGRKLFEGVVYELGKSKNPSVFMESSLDSGEKVFAGAYMFADHPSYSEEWDRPERSVRDLVGMVVSAERGETDAGQKALLGTFFISEGEPGLQAKITEGLVTGLSINAYVDAEFDEELMVWIINGFLDPEVDNVMPPSVDLVTYPAAGGFIAARESFRIDSPAGEKPMGQTTQAVPPPAPQPQQTPTEAEVLRQDIQTLRAQLERRDLVEGMLESIRAAIGNLPTITQSRILANAAGQIADFKLGRVADLPTLQASIDAMIEGERAYVSQLTKAGVPPATSFSWSASAQTPAEADEEDMQAIDAFYSRFQKASKR